MALISSHLETDSDRKLDAYVVAVRDAVEAGTSAEATVEKVVLANHRLLSDQSFALPERYCGVRPDVPYTRNLIYLDPNRRFSVIAICWGPFQETRIHDHLHWCVVGVHRGVVHAMDYERLDDEADPKNCDLAMRASGLHHPGSIVGLTPPPRSNIHKMANAGRDCAVSIHTYGDPGNRARVFDAVTGRVEVLDLAFHNLP